MDDGLMTIEALGEAVRAALDGEDAPSNGQVRAVPDVRTIRYYTTLGLLDRPRELRGRTAYYDAKHVLQLVAVKRLQAEGLSLAEVQARLTGLSASKLRRLAGVEGKTATTAPAAPAPTREDFWRTPPAESGPEGPETPEASEAPQSPQTGASTGALHPASPQALRLGPEVLLVMEGARPLTDEDRRRLTDLAAPLLAALEALSAPRGEEEEGT